MLDPNMPPTLHDLVDRELEPSESVQWTAMPTPAFFTPNATGLFLFGIPWTAFAIFWTAMAAWGTMNAKDGPGAFSFFPLFGLPFVLIGIGMLSSPIWEYHKAFKTVYVITDRRAIAFDGGWSTTIRSFPPEKLTEVFRREKADGSDDVIISQREWLDSDKNRKTEEHGFYRIAEVQDVERLLKDLARSPRPANTMQADQDSFRPYSR